MKPINSIISNSILSIISIYIPLVSYCGFRHITTSHERQVIEDTRFIPENQNNIVNAINEGLIPMVAPSHSKIYALKSNIYPIGQYPYKNYIYCDEGYGLIRFKSDRFGLRNPDSNWNNTIKKDNIKVIGDSFAHGACVKDNFSIPRAIENSTKINTLNLAAGGNGPYEYMALLKTIVEPLNKKSDMNNWVILIFYDNDNIEPNRKAEKLLKRAKPIISLDPDGSVFPTDDYKSKITNILKVNFPSTKESILKAIKEKEIVKTSKLSDNSIYQIMTLFRLRRRIQNAWRSLFPSISERSIEMLSKVCNKDCTPIVSYIPNSSFWYPNEKSWIYKNEIKSSAFKYGVRFVDGEEVIDSDERKDYAPNGGHLSTSGYKKYSNLLSKEINETKKKAY